MQWVIGESQRRVGGHRDSQGLAKVEHLFLGHVQVALNLRGTINYNHKLVGSGSQCLEVASHLSKAKQTVYTGCKSSRPYCFLHAVEVIATLTFSHATFAMALPAGGGPSCGPGFSIGFGYGIRFINKHVFIILISHREFTLGMLKFFLADQVKER